MKTYRDRLLLYGRSPGSQTLLTAAAQAEADLSEYLDDLEAVVENARKLVQGSGT